MRKQLKRWYKEWPPRKGQSGEKVPHYCKSAREWRCRIGKYETRGNIEAVFEELTQFCETYDYLVRENQSLEESWHSHFCSIPVRNSPREYYKRLRPTAMVGLFAAEGEGNPP